MKPISLLTTYFKIDLNIRRIIIIISIALYTLIPKNLIIITLRMTFVPFIIIIIIAIILVIPTIRTTTEMTTNRIIGTIIVFTRTSIILVVIKSRILTTVTTTETIANPSNY